MRVEKFLTPEEWKKQEEEKKIDEERKLREKKDNWRERGLEMMMGGVLEIKKEDELKKVLHTSFKACIYLHASTKKKKLFTLYQEIPVPAFMLEKIEDKWTDEEKAIANEYRAQIKFLEEEREKFKKVNKFSPIIFSMSLFFISIQSNVAKNMQHYNTDYILIITFINKN